MKEIIPAILPETVTDLEKKISVLPEEVSFFHMDVLEKDIWADIELDFEAHLMVLKPGEIARRWADRGAKRIIVHKLEAEIKNLRGKVEIGLAVELQTPLEDVFPLVPEVDFIHLMSIGEIGAQGRPLDEQIFDRIKKVREYFPQITVSVDGGIKLANYHALENSGADRLIIGSGFKELWNSLTKK